MRRLLFALTLLTGCAVGPSEPLGPLRVSWQPPAAPRAVVVTVHGFNDRKAAFEDFGAHAAQHGVAVVAYDQPGFGARPDRGRWPEGDGLVAALAEQVRAARRRWPAAPVYLLGESMGAAVVTVAAARGAVAADGVVLVSPAVWGGDSLSPYYRRVLQVAALVYPSGVVTGRGLNILASDNIPMLRALGADPLYLPTARIDAIAGLVALMDDARELGPSLTLPRLVLTGQHDRIVPPVAINDFVANLEPAGCTAVTYLDGWHLLLRDLQRQRVWDDIVGWIGERRLPSGFGRACAPLEPLPVVATAG